MYRGLKRSNEYHILKNMKQTTLYPVLLCNKVLNDFYHAFPSMSLKSGGHKCHTLYMQQQVEPQTYFVVCKVAIKVHQ